MKMKTKLIAMVEIAVVLCSVFLVAIPAIAAEQNQGMQEVSATASEVATASEDDYVLEIYGNANEDDTIDMGDVVYTKLAIFGKKPKTELCDAKYDGRINVLDVIQTKLIILGKEKEITLIDSADRIVTVKKPIKKVIPLSSYATEMMRSLKAADKIVAVISVVVNENIFFPDLSDLPNMGGWPEYDYEKIAELQPDLVFVYAGGYYDKIADKIESIVPGVTVVRSTPSSAIGIKNEVYTDEIKKLGYILDREDEAEEFRDWYEGWLSKIRERTAKLSEDEKPKVFFIFNVGYLPSKCYTVNRLSVAHDMIVDAGGINIAADLTVVETSYPFIVDPEWVIKQNPEIIIAGRSSVLGYKMDKPTEVEMEEEIDIVLNQPGWGHITAVKERSVYLTPSRLRKGPTLITAYQAKLFQPDLFEDLDPQVIHQEYIDRFCPGLDFDVKKDGVFIYPPLEES